MGGPSPLVAGPAGANDEVMTTRSTPHPRPHRTRRMTFDPYIVQDTTWTREELLRARGEKVRHTSHHRRPKAA